MVGSDYENKLSTYVELISDEFQSTFSIVDENTLANMLGLKNDFMTVTKIIHKYLPDHKVWFMKTGSIDDSYDIYFVRALPRP